MSIHNVLSDLAFIVSQGSPDASDVYDRAAPRYNHFRDLWLRIAGEHAERAMLQTIREVAGQRWRVLDAGAGTGILSHHVLEIEPDSRVTMLDISENMLRLASDADGKKVRASVLQLPFSDGSFDLVISGWSSKQFPIRARPSVSFCVCLPRTDMSSTHFARCRTVGYRERVPASYAKLLRKVLPATFWTEPRSPGMIVRNLVS
jgi:SAM-dependent methyltransferase